LVVVLSLTPWPICCLFFSSNFSSLTR
jgi:hypothetical protein